MSISAFKNINQHNEIGVSNSHSELKPSTLENLTLLVCMHLNILNVLK